MAKAGGKVNQKPPRPGRRLGVKLFGGQKTICGNIIIRQPASNFHPGKGTKMGKDYTIFAIKQGTVNFRILNGRKIVEVV